MTSDKKIIHLINCDIKGGVEVGAKKAKNELKSKINYQIKFIYSLRDNNFLKIKKAILLIYQLLKIKKKEDKKIIIISSLWMAHIVCFIIKIISSKFYWISFIHSSIYATIFNKFICLKLTKFANKIIFDSQNTSNFYLKKKNDKNIVNFYFQNKISNFELKNWNKRKYDFIIVARNIKVKGCFDIEKFIMFWILKYRSNPRLLIITNNLYKDVNLFNIKKNFRKKCLITLRKNINNQEVLKYFLKSKMYVCLSHSEGFGMSITEAILNGCYVITTNVGEQKRYLYPKRRSLIRNINKCDINYTNVNKIGKNKENFEKAKKFLELNSSYYRDDIQKIISEVNNNG